MRIANPMNETMASLSKGDVAIEKLAVILAIADGMTLTLMMMQLTDVAKIVAAADETASMTIAQR